MDIPESDLLTVSEAAAFLRLKPTTVRAWLLKRKLAHLKLGGRVFLRHSDLRDLIDRCFVPALQNRADDAFKAAGTSPPPSAKAHNIRAAADGGGR